ncbi:TetR/AcrR family transcriptional regulator [Nocardia yamanashiensis]|uniref:TetR/AcrR family transcriptional regulator n=1 Tax=Nocardia yamanashiensis TaxID=209247 RepID=UPI0008328BC6|nr:TetR/AcrR family transcriptional regulator [Nocardia yamanashiensis]UGT42475.1 TetR/AcrR family transcriptional regulator [Nocardia yamanashiensis]
MSSAVPTRRERRRSETTAEIKAVALRLMADGGPGAITLRAIAREMGMTANAVYSYFATRDDLVTALIADVYGQLADAVEAARDARPADDAAGRILAWACAFREWSLANEQGFRLIYGDPVPGYQPPPGGPAPEAEHRACTGLTGLVAGAWPGAERTYAEGDFDWADFGPELVATIRAEFPGLPPAAVAIALRLWGRMHGLVALEVLGRLGIQTANAGKLYRAEITHLIRSLGLTPPD